MFSFYKLNLNLHFLADIGGPFLFQKNRCIAFSETNSELCMNHLLLWSNSSFLHIFQLITIFPSVQVFYYYHFTLLRVFHTTVSQWSSTGHRVKVGLLKSSGLISVSWQILILSLGWFPLVLLFPIPPVPLSIHWWLFHEHQLQLVSPSLPCSKVFSVLLQDYYYYFTPGEFFYITVSWWFITGVWVRASFLKSPGLFSVLKPISTML